MTSWAMEGLGWEVPLVSITGSVTLVPAIAEPGRVREQSSSKEKGGFGLENRIHSLHVEATNGCLVFVFFYFILFF